MNNKERRGSWKFTNDREKTEYGTRAAVLEYLETVPGWLFPLLGFVVHVDAEGRQESFIPTMRKRYDLGGEYRPALVRFI